MEKPGVLPDGPGLPHVHRRIRTPHKRRDSRHRRHVDAIKHGGIEMRGNQHSLCRAPRGAGYANRLTRGKLPRHRAEGRNAAHVDSAPARMAATMPPAVVEASHFRPGVAGDRGGDRFQEPASLCRVGDATQGGLLARDERRGAREPARTIGRHGVQALTRHELDHVRAPDRTGEGDDRIAQCADPGFAPGQCGARRDQVERRRFGHAREFQDARPDQPRGAQQRGRTEKP